jgi:hypothetical protein
MQPSQLSCSRARNDKIDVKTERTHALASSLSTSVIKRMERNRRMGEGTACAHFGSDPDGLHDFLLARALSDRRLGVALDAVWALRHMSHRNGDQLLGLSRQGAVLENGLTELAEGLVGVRRKIVAPLRYFPAQLRVRV